MPIDINSFFDVYETLCQTSCDSMDEDMVFTDQQVPQLQCSAVSLPTFDFIKKESAITINPTNFHSFFPGDITDASLPGPTAGCPTVTAVNDQEVFNASPSHVTDIDQYPLTLYDQPQEPLKYPGSVCSFSADEQTMHDQIYTLATKDILDECHHMNISLDPTQWSPEDVRKWIEHMCQKYVIPDVHLDLFQMNGKCLCLLSEHDFLARSRAGGSSLFSQLLIWKHYFKVEEKNEATNQFFHDSLVDSAMGFDILRESPSPESPSPASPGSASLDSMHSLLDSPHSHSSEVDDTAYSYQPKACSRKPRPPSSCSRPTEHKQTIHLWQFLKELLQKPESFSHCIKWLDPKRGIFKIEDSVKVAKEWGRRKNRPAMNYDKLSRSIRQYYKKKIIKKTEHSKRLVYQFCDNYL